MLWAAFVHHFGHPIIRPKRTNFQQFKNVIRLSSRRLSTKKFQVNNTIHSYQYQFYHHDSYESSRSSNNESFLQNQKQTKLRERDEQSEHANANANENANIILHDPAAQTTLQKQHQLDMLEQMQREDGVRDQRQSDADDVRLKKIGIIAYGDGFWKTTDHEIVVGSIMLTPTYAFLWEANSWDEVTIESIEFALFINPKPELVIFGSGQEVQRPNDDVEDWLYENQVKYEVYDSPQAASVFTQLNDENRRVVAFLISAEFPEEDMAKRFLEPKDYRRPDLDPEYELQQERKKAEREKRRIERHRRK